MKVYTKKGDKGYTMLLGGERVPKSHLRIEAYGTIDELNSILSFLPYYLTSRDDLQNLVFEVQHLLFLIGAHLAQAPGAKVSLAAFPEEALTHLERSIDAMEKDLPPLRNFILPGGTVANSYAHLARTVCRRAERACVALHTHEPLEAFILKYLNRLSDWLFVLARYFSFLNQAPALIWKPPKPST